MARKLELYRFRDGITPLSEAELNKRFFDIDARIHTLEEVKISWDEAVSVVNNEAIKRINEVLQPAVDDVEQRLQAIDDEWAQKKADYDAQMAQIQSDFDAIQQDYATIQQDWANIQEQATEHPSSIDPHFQFAYTTDMTYDTSGNLVQVDYLVGGVLRKRETYNYDTNGNLASINTKVYDADGTMVLVEYNDNFAYVGDDLDYIERVMA